MDQHFNRKPGVFVIAAGEVFSFRPDWHEYDRARPLVRQYQITLDAVLRDRPDLASCAVHCRHCGIRFLTHPRNANRRDLHCPFGCREHHRRQQANERSKNHYRTDRGRRNKKRLNGKRSTGCDGIENGVSPNAAPPETSAADEDPSPGDALSALEPVSVPPPDSTDRATQAGVEEGPSEDVRLILEGFTLDEVTLVNSSMLPYLAMIASLIEVRTISPAELLLVLRKSMRQRSFDRQPRREYVLGFLDQHPP